MADPTPDNLFDGITAIADAGGVQPFATEVLAESKRISFARLRNVTIRSEEEAMRVFDASLYQVIERRLKADWERIVAERVVELMDARYAPDERPGPEALGIIDEATEALSGRLDAIVAAITAEFN